MKNYNMGAFEAHEDTETRKLLLRVLPYFNKQRKMKFEDAFFYALCEFLEDDLKHYIWFRLTADDAEPFNVIEALTKLLIEEYKEFIVADNENRLKGMSYRNGKVGSFVEYEWDETKTYTTHNHLLIRFSKNNKFVSIKKHTEGLIGSIKDVNKLLKDSKTTIDDLTIPQFFKLVSTIGTDKTPDGERYFNKYKTIKLFYEDMLTEKGIKRTDMKTEKIYDIVRGLINKPKEDIDLNDAFIIL